MTNPRHKQLNGVARDVNHNEEKRRSLDEIQIANGNGEIWKDVGRITSFYTFISMILSSSHPLY